jgi:nucleoside-diphosphate-sugar epimerase
MNVVVIGGGGFLGSALVHQLLDAGHDVTACGRGDYPEIAALGARTLRVDIGDARAVRGAVAGRDLVYHVAAKAGVWGDPAEYRRINVEGTRHVLTGCLEGRVPRLVYTSSPSVVFDGEDHENAGNDLPYAEHFEAAYPETKAAAEKLVLAANGPQLATVALRPHLIYGPRDPHLFPRLIARARAGRLRIVGDGKNTVSITYVDNAARAHVQAGKALEPGASWAGRAYFVNDAEPVVLWEWLQEIFEALGLPRITRRVSERLARLVGSTAETLWRVFPLSGEPPMTRFVAAQLARSHSYSLAPAREAFGYAPLVSATEASSRTTEYWRAHLG